MFLLCFPELLIGIVETSGEDVPVEQQSVGEFDAAERRSVTGHETQRPGQ